MSNKISPLDVRDPVVLAALGQEFLTRNRGKIVYWLVNKHEGRGCNTPYYEIRAKWAQEMKPEHVYRVTGDRTVQDVYLTQQEADEVAAKRNITYKSSLWDDFNLYG